MAIVRSIKSFHVPGLPQIVPILAILMEVLWAYSWLIWISGWATWGWTRPPLSIISCIILAAFTEMIARWALNRTWSLKVVRLIVLLSSLILLGAVVRWNLGGGYSFWDSAWPGYAATQVSSLVIIAIFGIFLIWRGIASGSQRFSFSDLYRKFLIGMVGFIILLIVWGLAGGGGRIWSSLGVYIIIYFGVGLLALAISNLETLRAELLKHKEDISAFTRRWLSMLVVLILAILGLSVALASIFSTNLLSTIVHGLGILGNWLLIALSYILLPVGYIFEVLIYLGRLLISWLTRNQQPVKFEMPDLSDLQKMAEGQSPVQIPAWIILVLKWGGLAIVIGLVIFFLARALMRFWEARAEKEIEEVHETLFSWNTFKMDLRVFLSWLFRWARRRKPAPVSESFQTPAPALSDEGDSGRLFSIRELYQALLWQGRQLGTPRRKAETPYEYRHKIKSRISTAADEIDALTEAYIIERYGQENTAPERLSRLNSLWRSLRSKLINPKPET